MFGAPWGFGSGGGGSGQDTYRNGSSSTAAAAASTPSWSALAAAHAGQYAAVAALLVLLAISERATPFHKVFYYNTDAELWQYSYPLKVWVEGCRGGGGGGRCGRGAQVWGGDGG